MKPHIERVISAISKVLHETPPNREIAGLTYNEIRAVVEVTCVYWDKSANDYLDHERIQRLDQGKLFARDSIQKHQTPNEKPNNEPSH